LTVLENCRHGGCASVVGYSPDKGWIDRPYQNIQFISRVSTGKLYARRIAALEALEYGDIASDVARDSKLSDLTASDALELFNTRKQGEIDSMSKPLTGNTGRSDAHRQGHDRCYIHVSQGVKVHLVTEKVDGIMQPILRDGFPTVNSVMVEALFLNVRTTVEGTRKVVNSGCPVRMSNLIAKHINNVGNQIRFLSLKADNFEYINIDHNAIIAKELHELVA
jgi:hypothetical protein